MNESMSDISRRLDEIETRINTLEDAFRIEIFLAVPDSLRKTLIALRRLGRATILEVSQTTGRSYHNEVLHLNELRMLGYLTREKQGNKSYFKFAF